MIRMLIRSAAIMLICGMSATAFARERTQWDGVYTRAQSERGHASYEKACASCHTSDLTGRDHAPALIGKGFSLNWDNFTIGELFERIKFTMPQTEPNSLPASVVADIITYILMKNGYMPGAEELSHKPDAMDEIHFRAEKPAD